MAIKAWIPGPEMVGDVITTVMRRLLFIGVVPLSSRRRSVIAARGERDTRIYRRGAVSGASVRVMVHQWAVVPRNRVTTGTER